MLPSSLSLSDTHIGLDLLARGEADGIGNGREGVLAFGRDLILDIVRPDGIGGARWLLRQARVRVPFGQTPIRIPGAEALRAQEVRFSDEVRHEVYASSRWGGPQRNDCESSRGDSLSGQEKDSSRRLCLTDSTALVL